MKLYVAVLLVALAIELVGMFLRVRNNNYKIDPTAHTFNILLTAALFVWGMWVYYK